MLINILTRKYADLMNLGVYRMKVYEFCILTGTARIPTLQEHQPLQPPYPVFPIPFSVSSDPSWQVSKATWSAPYILKVALCGNAPPGACIAPLDLHRDSNDSIYNYSWTCTCPHIGGKKREASVEISIDRFFQSHLPKPTFGRPSEKSCQYS